MNVERPVRRLLKIFDIIISSLVVVLIGVLIAYLALRVGGVLTTMFGINVPSELKLELMSEHAFLHTIAYAIILIKAYRILVSYVETHHLNIKFLVEISIIAAALEIIFNTSAHSDFVLGVFAIFGVANLLMYLFFYDRLRRIHDDYKEDAKEVLKLWNTK